MKKILTLSGLALMMTFPQLTQAQWEVGPHVVVSVPRSDFANVTDVGGGFGVKAIRRFRGVLALRGDFGFLSHGREFTTVQTNFGATFAEVRNESFRLTFGPELSTGGRSFRFFIGAQGGFYVFRTNTNVDFSGIGGIGFLQDSESDGALGWNVGGGFQYDVGLGPWIDVAFEYQTIYNVAATEGLDENNQPVTKDITANEYTIKAGVTFFLGR